MCGKIYDTNMYTSVKLDSYHFDKKNYFPKEDGTYRLKE